MSSLRQIGADWRERLVYAIRALVYHEWRHRDLGHSTSTRDWMESILLQGALDHYEMLAMAAEDGRELLTIAREVSTAVARRWSR